VAGDTLFADGVLIYNVLWARWPHSVVLITAKPAESTEISPRVNYLSRALFSAFSAISAVNSPNDSVWSPAQVLMRYRRRRRTGNNLFLILFGLIFALCGVFAGVVFGQTSTLTCRRLESTVVDCRLQRDLLGIRVSETEVGQVESAWVDVNADSDGDTYRVMLQGPDGSTPLTSYLATYHFD
jgi:hypothetical protein